MFDIDCRTLEECLHIGPGVEFVRDRTSNYCGNIAGSSRVARSMDRRIL